MAKKKKGYRLQWHPAFYAGLQIELGKDAGNLIFENEHQLSTKPLEAGEISAGEARLPFCKKRRGDIPYRWQ